MLGGVEYPSDVGEYSSDVEWSIRVTLSGVFE